MIDREHALPVTHQRQILALARSSVDTVPQPVAATTLALMRQIDELHRQHPFAGSPHRAGYYHQGPDIWGALERP